MPSLTFRTKPFTVMDRDRKRPAIRFKVKVSRSDTDMRPADHAYFNSDLFPAILQRAYATAIGPDRPAALGQREWAYLDDLPPAVTVDTSGFLARVTVRLTFDPRHVR